MVTTPPNRLTVSREQDTEADTGNSTTFGISEREMESRHKELLRSWKSDNLFGTVIGTRTQLSLPVENHCLGSTLLRGQVMLFPTHLTVD